MIFDIQVYYVKHFFPLSFLYRTLKIEVLLIHSQDFNRNWASALCMECFSKELRPDKKMKKRKEKAQGPKRLGKKEWKKLNLG